MSLLNGAEKRVQNRVQTTAEQSCTESQETLNEPVVSPYNCESEQEFATVCESIQNSQKYPQGESNPCLQDENLIS